MSNDDIPLIPLKNSQDKRKRMPPRTVPLDE